MTTDNAPMQAAPAAPTSNEPANNIYVQAGFKAPTLDEAKNLLDRWFDNYTGMEDTAATKIQINVVQE